MNKYILNIEGMRCGMCESHVNDTIRKNFNVKKVTSSHLSNETVIITIDEISDEKFHEVIDPTGYELKGIKKEEATKKGLFWK